jgi:FGGY-family pentulose kinase
MDLADFMVFRSTGSDRRSFCTSVCKWTYLGHKSERGCWDYSFFSEVGLSDIFEGGKVPGVAYPVGNFGGHLNRISAKEFDLKEGISVGIGIIDAHAGALGVLGPVVRDSLCDKPLWNRTMALIVGTSSCHMALSLDPRFISGIWGPYYGVMMPNMWLNEGGQSATGSLIDYTIRNNSSHEEIKALAQRLDIDVYKFLNLQIERYKRETGIGPEVTTDLHVLPYHHGNRSPRAVPHAKGIVVGLTLAESVFDVAKLYYATIQAIAYGTRHIIEEMNRNGYDISDIYICGGHLKNRLFLQEHADITGCKLHLPRQKESVLLGAGILGAVAAGEFTSVTDAMIAMSKSHDVIEPNSSYRKYHDKKYAIFHRMYHYFEEITALSSSPEI